MLENFICNLNTNTIFREYFFNYFNLYLFDFNFYILLLASIVETSQVQGTREFDISTSLIGFLTVFNL